VLSNIVSLCARCHALAHGESARLHEVAEKKRVESYVSRKTDGRLGGRPRSYDEKTMKEVYALRASGQTFSSIARTLGLARATVHRINAVYMGIANEGSD
jgi:DNA invertase Pin-like site-specific DNA recombinase